MNTYNANHTVLIDLHAKLVSRRAAAPAAGAHTGSLTLPAAAGKVAARGKVTVGWAAVGVGDSRVWYFWGTSRVSRSKMSQAPTDCLLGWHTACNFTCLRAKACLLAQRGGLSIDPRGKGCGIILLRSALVQTPGDNVFGLAQMYLSHG